MDRRQPVILYSRKYEAVPGQDKPVLLVLHGLYGQQGNWTSHARALADDFTVYALDARNHGQSSHADSMALAEMAQDVSDTMDALGLQQAHLLGHSMGGKIAMLLALTQPQRVQSLLVVDIAPVAYPHGDVQVLQGLMALDLAALLSRSAADEQLAAYVHTPAVRDFLLTNLVKDSDGSFHWRFNLPVLASSFGEIIGWRELSATYKGPVLFIKGANSDYILPEHQAVTLKLFPRARLKTVQGAGHWVHSEKVETFRKLARDFLLDSSSHGSHH
jgi:esterase